MSPWLSIVALLGWAILAFSSYRAYRVSGKTALMQVAIWTAIFLVVALVFGSVGG